MRIPLHGKADPVRLLDHWMDSIGCRQGDDGFRAPRTSRKRAKARGPVKPTRIERLARDAYK